MTPRATLLLFGILLGLGCKDQDGGYTCFPGNEGCPCVHGGCLPGLECIDELCEPPEVSTSSKTDTDDTTDTDNTTTSDDPTTSGGTGTTGP